LEFGGHQITDFARHLLEVGSRRHRFHTVKLGKQPDQLTRFINHRNAGDLPLNELTNGLKDIRVRLQHERILGHIIARREFCQHAEPPLGIVK
jgi:hypothetical protein